MARVAESMEWTPFPAFYWIGSFSTAFGLAGIGWSLEGYQLGHESDLLQSLILLVVGMCAQFIWLLHSCPLYQGGRAE